MNFLYPVCFSIRRVLKTLAFIGYQRLSGFSCRLRFNYALCSVRLINLPAERTVADLPA